MSSFTTRAASARRLGIAVSLGLFALLPLVAAAHETREVDQYEFVVGFIDEPAIVDEVNGIWVEITLGGEPVEGLADTLEAEVLFGEETREAPLTPAYGEPGVYVSRFIPMAEGDYTFHFFGEIDGVAVDETFTSSPEGFDSVAARSGLEFPSAEAMSSREVAMPLIVGGAVLLLGFAGLALRRRAE